MLNNQVLQLVSQCIAEGPVGAERSRPLLQGVVEFLWIPTELALNQQVHSASVMAVVLQHELLPWKGEEILSDTMNCQAFHSLDFVDSFDLFDSFVSFNVIQQPKHPQVCHMSQSLSKCWYCSQNAIVSRVCNEYVVGIISNK